MDSRVLQYQLRTHMTAGQSYSYAGMDTVYSAVMGIDQFTTEDIAGVICEKTLRNYLNAWAGIDGGWLEKKGRGEDARFTKVDYITPCVFSKLHGRAMDIYNRGKSLWPRL